MVRSPVIVKFSREPDTRRLSNVIDGYFAESKKSGERRCSSRFGSPVISVVTSIAALTDDNFGSPLASTTLPEMPVKRPFTFETIMCRTLNSTRLWELSMCHADQLWISGVVVLAALVDIVFSLLSRGLPRGSDALDSRTWC